MKKWILVGLVGLLLLGLGAAMYNGVMNDQATELIDEKWTVESDQIQERPPFELVGRWQKKP